MNGAPFVPLAEPLLSSACVDAVAEQVRSGFVGPGPTTQAFAEAVAALAGTSRCILTTSGTVALSVAAHALRLRAGDEILVPAYGVISTINAFASIGLRPRLVDIDAASGCMDPNRLEASITPRTKAVCFVDFSGHTGEPLQEAAWICARHGLPLIEDAACALGHRFNGRSAGTFGTVGTYSFSVPKVLTTGQGGAVITGDDSIGDRAAAFIDHGDLEWRRTNLNREVGTNLRFNDVSAALGLAQMHELAARLERRRRAYEAMRHALSSFLYRVPGAEAPLHNIVFTSEPDGLVAALRSQQIGAVRQYRTLSQHPAYAELGGDYRNADHWTERAVYLPFGMALDEATAVRIASAVLNSGVPLSTADGQPTTV